MGRRRFVQIDGELVEVTPDYEARSRNGAANAGILWNDRQYQDAGDKRFASRSQHREFMKKNGLTTADDFKSEWKKGEQRRMDIRRGVDPTVRKSIVETIRKLTHQGKR